MTAYPNVRFALDNPGRIYDSAFDLVEDGPPLDTESINAIHRHLDEAGLYWAQSSVHINFFQSQFNKAAMVQRYFDEVNKKPGIASCLRSPIWAIAPMMDHSLLPSR